MQRAIVSANPKKIEVIKKKLEEIISNRDDMFVEIAIVVYAPPNEMESLRVKAICHDANSFMII